MEKNIINLLKALLDDEYGVSEEAWEMLNLLVLKLFGRNVPKEICDILDQVEATDGRYYLPM